MQEIFHLLICLLVVELVFEWFWRGKIKNSLLTVFLAVGLVPALLTFAVSYYFTGRSVMSMSFDNLRYIADEKAGFIETWFLEKASFIRYMASREEAGRLEADRIIPLLEKALDTHPDYVDLVVTDGRGITLAAARRPPGADMSVQPCVKAALDGFECISGVLEDPYEQKTVVVMASPVKKDSGVAGAFLGIVDLGRVNQEINRSFSGKTGETFLVGRDGVMVTESRFAPELISRGVVREKTSMELKIKTVDVEEALQGRSGTGVFEDYRGVEVVSSYRWMPDIKMALVTKKDLSEIMEEARRETGYIAAVITLAMLMFIPMVVITSRKLSYPLELLAEGADRIAGGDYGYRVDLQSNREIDALAESFNRMSGELSESHSKMVEQIKLLEIQKKEITNRNLQLAEANIRLEMLAITDQLTGAYNRRHIVNQLEQELAIAARHNLPLSIIMIDIDHFKSINDQHGHQVGDEVLKEIVHVLKESVRTSDIIGRYGGEEFIVIAPLTGIREAVVLAERLRETVSRWPFETTYGFLKLTISLGVATYDGSTDEQRGTLVDRLLAKSDEEMYRAKAQGRNRVSPALSEAGAVNSEAG
ncbi:MAG TPA: diguanylate cyclase [Bacillota bacterium]|nr:diguanylate cyclase [Bacillota bacterium]